MGFHIGSALATARNRRTLLERAPAGVLPEEFHWTKKRAGTRCPSTVASERDNVSTRTCGGNGRGEIETSDVWKSGCQATIRADEAVQGTSPNPAGGGQDGWADGMVVGR